MSLKKYIFEIAETFITSLIVVLSIFIFVASVEVVWGASMEPNFHTGERILVDKVSKYFKTYQRGEVVVLTPPYDHDKHYIKRIIGLPGDIIKVVDCSVFISREGERFKLEETYLSDGMCTLGGSSFKEGRSLKISENQYLVLGDNRSNSLDSRSFGLVDKSEIVGRVIFRFWPATKLGFIK